MRPEKKEPYPFIETDEVFITMKRQGEVVGYNQACDDWEKWINDNIEEMVTIMRDIQLSSSPGERAEDMNRRIAKAISRRLR